MIKFRKILCIGMVICTLFALTACVGNIQAAKWEGYTTLSFMDFLEQGIYNTIIKEDVDVSFKLRCENGWGSATKLDETDLSSGTKPITYIISTFESTYAEDGFEEIDTELYFFMELNPLKNTLSAKGAAFEKDGELVDTLKASETKEFLNELKRNIN